VNDNTSQIALWQIRITAAFLALGLGSIVIFWKQLPPQVPLLYSRAWGVDQLVSPVWLFILPAICLGVGTLAYFITRLFQDKVLLVTSIISLITIQSIVVLALLRIIVLVI
jgi:hypothetical protein